MTCVLLVPMIVVVAVIVPGRPLMSIGVVTGRGAGDVGEIDVENFGLDGPIADPRFAAGERPS